jgi:hypothetical protein
MKKIMQAAERLAPSPEGLGYELSKPSKEGSALKGVLAITIFTSLLLLGCENQPSEVEDYEPQAVLQGYLINGQPVDSIYLQWVAPLYGYYDVSAYGIAGAEMIVYPLSGAQDTLHLASDAINAWIYRPANGETLIPLSGETYRVEVSKPEDGIYLTSEALMPDSFACAFLSPLLAAGVDTLDTLTRNDPNLYIAWEEAAFAGGYNLNVTCLEPEEFLLPLDPDFNPDEDDLEPEEIELTAFWPMRYDQFEMAVPWFLFNYEGWHRIEVQAITSEYYDYGLSIFRADAGMPIELASNINGGLGIFAALATNRYWVYMVRVE